MTSFGLQVLVGALLLLMPLLRPTGLPLIHRLSTPISLGEPRREVAAARARTFSNPAEANSAEVVFRRPSALPITRHPLVDDGPPQVVGSGPYVPGTPGSGTVRGFASLSGSGSPPVLPMRPPMVVAHPVRPSQMSEGDLVQKILPVYPALARSARVQGTVVLQAMISKQGTIEDLKVVTGHPMLVPAAIDAVRRWRYRPYVLNNEPVEVETQITVNFSLDGN
ncbi:MAG: energy transducer TonB [Candidatus Sulfotelmatobacter sp.]